MWYAAHAVMVARFKSARQRTFPVWENIYLIWAATDEEAERKARKVALQAEGDSRGSFRWEGKPAAWKLEGIRRLTKCPTRTHPNNMRSFDGLEVAFNEYVFVDSKSLNAFVEGEQIRVAVNSD
jgi:hypothetical protein